MDLRDTRVSSILIAALIAVGAWYAKCPEAAQRALPQLQLGSEVETPKSFVNVRRVCWSPDSRKLLSASHGEVGWDGPLVLHDLDDCPRRMPIDMTGEMLATAALAPDGRHVLVATHAGRFWWIGLESDERKLLLELPARIGISAAALSADGRQAALASTDGSIYLCQPDGSAPALFASGLGSQISDLRFSSDGRWLVSAGQDGWLRVWDLPSGRVLQKWRAHDRIAMAAAFLSDDRIISAGLDDTVRIWSISTGHEIWRGEFGLFGVTALAVSADGKTAAWGGYNRKLVVWDLVNARKKYEIEVPASIVWDVEFSPDNQSLAVAGTEGMLRVYDRETGTEKAVLELGQIL